MGTLEGAAKSPCKECGFRRGKGVWPSLQSTTVILGSLYVVSHFTLERHRARVRTLFSEKDQTVIILGFIKPYLTDMGQYTSCIPFRMEKAQASSHESPVTIESSGSGFY